MRFWTIYFLTLLGTNTDAATHWVVTEKGMIQSHMGSPLDLRRPYDLISLLDQEKRWNEIQTVLQDLMSRKTAIEEKWSTLEEHPGIESKMALKNSDCLMNVKLLSNVDLYQIATNGSDRVDLKLPQVVDDINIFETPDCTKYSEVSGSLDSNFSTGFNTILEPDQSVQKLIPSWYTVSQYGHEVHRRLAQNGSSWLDYNLATLYWRIRGEGGKAMSCSKRALNFSPDLYKDIPLHNLAGILHKSGRSKEAALVLLKAIELAPLQALHYLALGNVYFGLGDCNSSLIFYDKFLELKPNHKEVAAVKQATLCFSKLETHLIDFQKFLQGILGDLHDFRSLQQHWLRLSKRLMWEHSSYNEELGNLQEEALETVFGKKKQRCVKKSSTISCDLVESPITDFDTMNLQNLFQYVETETQKINERVATSNLLTVNEFKERGDVPQTFPKFPNTMSTSGEKYFDTAGWPSEEECRGWNLPLTEKEELKLPVFLPPENKGYEIAKILTDSIGLPNGSEHKLPWYPPNCDDAFGEKFVQHYEKHHLSSEIKCNALLQNHFLKYVNEGKADEAEIGQRIITAMEKKSAPSWVLSTLASLYWRIRGNTKKALDCLDTALKAAPKEETDVVLISIGSIVHQLGLTNHALKYANLAFKLNYVEPSTNFLLALLQYDSNPLMAMYYMKNVLRVDPDYYGGEAERLLKIWGCRLKLGQYNGANQIKSKDHGKSSDEVCSDKESFKGQGVICSTNGDECKTASIQCFHTKNLEDGGVVLNFKKGHLNQIKARSRTVIKLYDDDGDDDEGSGDLEPDQSQLERIEDGTQPVQMKILLGEDPLSNGPTPEFYVGFSEDPAPETVLHVYDKSGTYHLSSRACREIHAADWLHFQSMWRSIAARNIDISSTLKSLPKNWKKRNIRPYCSDAVVQNPTSFLNHLTSRVLRGGDTKLPNSPELSLAEWLVIITGDQKSTTEELGAKIGLGLQEDNGSWMLATAAALYWRLLGDTEEAIVCLRLALHHAPDDMRDVPLISLANILQRIGFNSDALEVAYLALKSNPNFVVNHFTIGNILTSLGDLEEAISFHRAALAIDSNFEPARNRLQAILCSLLFDESGVLRNIPEN